MADPSLNTGVAPPLDVLGSTAASIGNPATPGSNLGQSIELNPANYGFIDFDFLNFLD